MHCGELLHNKVQKVFSYIFRGQTGSTDVEECGFWFSCDCFGLVRGSDGSDSTDNKHNTAICKLQSPVWSEWIGLLWKEDILPEITFWPQPFWFEQMFSCMLSYMRECEQLYLFDRDSVSTAEVENLQTQYTISQRLAEN